MSVHDELFGAGESLDSLFEDVPVQQASWTPPQQDYFPPAAAPVARVSVQDLPERWEDGGINFKHVIILDKSTTAGIMRRQHRVMDQDFAQAVRRSPVAPSMFQAPSMGNGRAF